MKFVAACALVAFVLLGVTDAFACCDGCRQASTSRAADECNATGACPLCTGAIAEAHVVVALVPLTIVTATPDDAVPSTEMLRLQSIDHPPRLS